MHNIVAITLSLGSFRRLIPYQETLRWQRLSYAVLCSFWLHAGKFKTRLPRKKTIESRKTVNLIENNQSLGARILTGLKENWPVRTTRNFVCFAKKSVNAKPFLVRTIFCTHQNFCKQNETSKIPSTSFGGCKNFVRRENPLFLDVYPSLGHQILQHMDTKRT